MHRVEAATHAVNFHVLPSTGVWSSWGWRVEIGKRDVSIKLCFIWTSTYMIETVLPLLMLRFLVVLEVRVVFGKVIGT